MWRLNLVLGFRGDQQEAPSVAQVNSEASTVPWSLTVHRVDVGALEEPNNMIFA